MLPEVHDRVLKSFLDTIIAYKRMCVKRSTKPRTMTFTLFSKNPLSSLAILHTVPGSQNTKKDSRMNFKMRRSGAVSCPEPPQVATSLRLPGYELTRQRRLLALDRTPRQHTVDETDVGVIPMSVRPSNAIEEATQTRNRCLPGHLKTMYRHGGVGGRLFLSLRILVHCAVLLVWLTATVLAHRP